MIPTIIINKTKLVKYIIGGLFTAKSGWQHETRTLKGSYELIICQKGSLPLQIDKQKYTLQKGDTLIVEPNSLMQGFPIKEDVQFYWLHFIFKNKISKDNNKQISIPLIGHLSNINSLIITINQLLAINTHQLYYREQQNILMTLLLTQLASESNAPETVTLISKIKEWIRTNIYRQISLQDIADHFGFNKQYLSKLFKKKVGITPTQYMIQLKIQTAKALLIETNLSIKEISSYSYYQDKKLFMKQFKHIVGITPSKYRDSYDPIYHNNQKIDPILPIPNDVKKLIEENIKEKDSSDYLVQKLLK